MDPPASLEAAFKSVREAVRLRGSCCKKPFARLLGVSMYNGRMLSAGKKFGTYEIVAHIGSGGMGDVYRARDPRLARDVAIKVLPSTFAQDPDRLQRFEQEARAAGMLNHPNILSIFDIGSMEGSTYLVTEYLEGETLREKLRTGPLSLRKAMDSAVQLARGLSAAHEKGIVHRDLKPENLIITKDGRLKILDFGLAKLTQPDATAGGLTQLPTSPGTEPGVILGTMGYMSPEQVRGKPADHRSDIFALGAIFYEMITGQHAFRGETAADTMSAILQKEPPEIHKTNSNVPPALTRMVQHCLEKDPEQRFHSASDIAFNLESLSGFSDTAVTTSVPPSPIRIPVTVWKVTAILSAIAAIALGFLYYRQIARPQRMLQASLEFPPNHIFPPGQSHGAAVSPNGKYVAFPAIEEGKPGRNLWIRDLEKSSAQLLAGTEGAFYPFWSPDSTYVAFFTEGKLKKVKYTGGAVQDICDAPSGRGGSWNSSGTILFAPQPYGGLYQVASAGGTPKAVTKVINTKTSHRWPYFLPDGKHFIFSNDEPRGIFAASLDSELPVQLNSEASNAVFTKQGYLLFVRQGNLVAQQFHPEKRQLEGEAKPIVEEKIFYDPNRWYGVFSVSDDDVLCYRMGGSRLSQPFWFDRNAKELDSAGEAGIYDSARLSPRGDKVSFTRDTESGKADLWVYELATRRFNRITHDAALTSSGVWSPDQSRLAYSSSGRIYQKRLTATSTDELLYESPQYANVTSWSPDGKFLLFNPQNQRGDNDVWVLPLSGNRKPYPLVATRFGEGGAEFSPDGKWVAYMSNASGQNQVYVKAFSGSEEEWQISTDVGLFPQWSSDGKELFFLSGAKAMSVTLMPGERPTFSTPEPLFDVPLSWYIVAGVDPDGRLLVYKTKDDAGDRVLRFIANWNQLLAVR
jgi:serine/threonine protein kinase